jgi:hypothetical protein
LQNKLLKFGFRLAVVLSLGALLIAGLNNYPGSKFVYLLFTGVFSLMLLTALNKQTPYAYLFLVVALWLGFWGKLVVHLLLKYPYVEPIGRFDGSASAWDDVLWVAILASTGVMLGKLLFKLVVKKYCRTAGIDQAQLPVWYSAIRKWVWSVSMVGIVGFAAINLIFGIQQIGLVPRTILPWPLNALIAWQVSIGSALLLTVLVWWEMTLKKSISVSTYALIIEAFVSTASLLSRGVYIFHTIPQLFSLFEIRKNLVRMSKIKIIGLISIFTGLMVISISGVTTFRAYLYPHAGGFTTEEQRRMTRLEVLEGGIANVKKLIARGEPQEGHLRELLVEKLEIEDQRRLARLEVIEGGITRVKILISKGEPQEGHLRELLAEKAQLETGISNNEVKSEVVVSGDKTEPKKSVASPASIPHGLLESRDELLGELYFQIGTGALPRMLTLVVDRWIGLEGVMAVSAYPEKSSTLLFDAITEKREIGKTTKFQIISNSHYRWTDASIWQFASLPGAVAFLYFSGSLLVVMLGMAMFAFLLQLGEKLVFFMTSNPILCSLFGLTSANSIAQFGITPRQEIPFYSMIFGFVLLVFVVQSDMVCRMIQKYRLIRGKGGAV